MEPEKELKWCSTKLGNGIALDAEAKTVSRHTNRTFTRQTMQCKAEARLIGYSSRRTFMERIRVRAKLQPENAWVWGAHRAGVFEKGVVRSCFITASAAQVEGRQRHSAFDGWKAPCLLSEQMRMQREMKQFHMWLPLLSSRIYVFQLLTSSIAGPVNTHVRDDALRKVLAINERTRRGLAWRTGDDTATAVIVCEKLGSEAFFGVVGNNFYPGV
eukprot:3849437-Pleurochrysis_carterae.AAC.3